MLTRSKSRGEAAQVALSEPGKAAPAASSEPPAEGGPEPAQHSSRRSRASRASCESQKKVAEAQYVKKMAELRLSEIAAQKEIAEATLKEQLAVAEAKSATRCSSAASSVSRRSAYTAAWMEQSPFHARPQNKWCDFAARCCVNEAPQLPILARFLEQEASNQVRFGPSDAFAAPSLRPAAPPAPPARPQPHARAVVNVATAAESSTSSSTSSPPASHPALKLVCAFCSAAHNLRSCPDFASLTVEDRWVWVRNSKGTCPRCLKNGRHKWAKCKAKCATCSKSHHTLLHLSSFVTTCQSQTESQTSKEENSNSVSKSLYTTKEFKNVNNSNLISNTKVFLKVVPVVLSGPKGETETYALLDDGSTTSLIDEDLARQLGLSGTQTKVHIENIIGGRSTKQSERVNFTIRGKYCSKGFRIQGAQTFSNLSLSPQSVLAEELVSLSYLRDIMDNLTYEDAIPKVLIGVCDWHLLVAKENRAGTRAQPAAIRTALGWVVFGCSSKATEPIKFINHFVKKDDELDHLIREFYSLDSLGIKTLQPLSTDEQRATEILESTARRLPNGRFEIGLPWREDNPEIPDSYNQALLRLQSLGRRMIRDESYADLYKLNIEAYVTKDYAEECLNSHDESFLPGKCWYLPHFGVTHPHKPGKLRVVHDAAAKTSGICLNSLLLPGPDLQKSLLGILIRFREGEVALSGDIREMFPQIKIRDRDREFQRYLWYPEGPRGPVKEFRMSSLIFGACSSPFSAMWVKNKNALEFQGDFPAATRAIIDDHYMDDFLGSTDSVAQATSLAADVFSIHAKCGFEMRDWVSNKPDALQSIPQDLRKKDAAEVNLDLEDMGVRVLGMFWNNIDDTFRFKVDLNFPPIERLSKRQVLRDLMRVYDPLGLVAPLITQGKILFQKTWFVATDWDSVLPIDQREQWHEWYLKMQSLHRLKIPRWYAGRSETIVERELHIFTDASSEAYACCAYWRFVFVDGTVKLAFIMSKTRVAPLKPISVPRLELLGTLIGARLASTIIKELKEKPTKKIFWTDSQTVLSWIRRDPRCFKTFVANRVGEIQEITTPSEWRWVPSAQNVADDATRSNNPSLDRWLVGPTFLLSSVEQWPSEPTESTFPGYDEIKCNELTVQRDTLPYSFVADSGRFSSWHRLLRATARAHQYIRILKERISLSGRVRRGPHPLSLNFNEAKPLLAQDIRSAELHLFRRAQEENSENIYSQNITLKHSADGLLRVDSRIPASPAIDEDARYPVVLDGRNHTTRLLIQSYHEWAAHANNQTVMNEIRQRFFILRLRATVRSVAAKCRLCQLRKAKAQVPPIGDLPEERTLPYQRPFTYCGLDYFGPVDVAVGRRREKRHVALFTCFSTRAVHLEVVNNLSADSAVMALRRFFARRGCPTCIYTDNGTSFVGANRVMQAHVLDFAASRRVGWRFIPPASPFMGGVWERLVGSVKRALNWVLTSKAPQEEILITLLAEAEHLVNSRPLTHVAVGSEEEAAITPNHFLLGSSSGLPRTPVELDDGVLTGRTNWQKAMRLADHFWSRWVREYLPELIPRPTSGSYTNLAVGDVVIIADPNLPRGTWPKGRITACYPGKDGIVRVADVATLGGTLRRPCRKLVKLLTE